MDIKGVKLADAMATPMQSKKTPIDMNINKTITAIYTSAALNDTSDIKLNAADNRSVIINILIIQP